MNAPNAGRAGPSPSKTWLTALESAGRLTADKAFVLADLIDRQAEAIAESPALIGRTETLSYRGLAALSRRYTRWALSQGLGRGDVAALLAPNGPSYFAFWTGVSRTGAAVSLLNTNLRGAGLAHAVGVSRPAHLVVAPAFRDAATEALALLEAKPTLWSLGEAPSSAGAKPLEAAAFSGEPLDFTAFAPAIHTDVALHIFTSGTTGLPKAARLSHGRIMSWIGWFSGLMGAQPKDRLYDCLPMYHSVGGVTAIGAMLAAGGSVVLRERFSASRFWADVADSGCTIAQYIGELCRYLLAAPPSPDERRHALRLICGNGLREEVWTAFQERFGIPRVLEFYAATEGSFSLYNVEGKPGAIGRAPPFLAHRFPAALVRHDPDAEAPARDQDGRCISCETDEVGEAIGKVSAEAAGAGAFEGYTDAAASEKKLLRDVFEPGDLWFRTGDLMRKDAAGFFYFVDRVGDAFRWKGENVSAGEVEAVLAACPGVKAAAVYGVAVPGAEGRAGMAALVPGAGFDLERLAARTEAGLRAYARPLFLRMMEALPATETFKVRKQALAAQGFEPSAGDAVYWLDPQAGAYAPLDGAALERIAEGRAGL
ncbi:MAG: long-chain-acyl-CoA synthetase [Caulobacteraceae bacterium]|nr:long-chain-acyl-CoA synthetase [Caulobacteraceae bacterium]